jgi:hypothetical protein
VDALLVVVVAVLHAAFLVYVAVGGFAAWRWPRAVVPHLGAVAWGVASIAAGLPCPLTGWESTFRHRAGWPALGPGGFVDHYLEGVLYPERYTPLVLGAVAGLVIVAWAGILWPGILARAGIIRPVGPARDVSGQR